MKRITPCLWFDDQAEQAAEFYCSIFSDSRIIEITRYTSAGPGPEGSVLTVHFELDGSEFIALNGGPLFPFTEAVSFSIDCADQAEIDYYWERLLEGGEPVQCGWLKDRYGLSWQVSPTELNAWVADPDPVKAARVTEVMLGMVKLDLEQLRAAYEGTL